METFPAELQAIVATRDRTALINWLRQQPIEYLEGIAHRSVEQRLNLYGQTRPLAGLLEVVADLLIRSGFVKGDNNILYYGCYANGWRVVSEQDIGPANSYTSHELMTLREAAPEIYRAR